MIRMNDRDQCLECTLCGECVEIPRRMLRDPEAMLSQREEAEAEHAPCEQWKEDPERARAERQYRAAMREEMEKEAQRQKKLTLVGRPRRQPSAQPAAAACGSQAAVPHAALAAAAAYLLRRSA
jgi:Fe-S oxidoreductase